MIIGPDIIYKCPICGANIFKGSLTSGNTFGAKLFSDAKQIAPMLPEFPAITKCRTCDSIFWFRNAEVVGEAAFPSSETVDKSNAYPATFLTIDEYLTAIDAGICESVDDEYFIRQRILWKFNDRVRYGDPLFNNEIEKKVWTDNINSLLDIIDYDDINQKILAAELHRYLGDFDKCLEIMDSMENPQLVWLKDAFREECGKKNKEVFQLN
jgi:hypothetical protein